MRFGGEESDGKRSGLAAYNHLQIRLMKSFIRHGGTESLFVELYAEEFRRRFGWMLEAGRDDPPDRES